MPKFFSSRQIVNILNRNGFVFVSQKGSHAKFWSQFKNKIVIVPMGKKQIPFGTFSSILRQSGLPRKFFEI